MKVIANYKGKSVELDIPDEKLEELVKEQKKTGWEKPKYGQMYWYIASDCTVEYAHWSGVPIDHNRYKYGNCYTVEKLALDMCRYHKLNNQIRRRIAEICEPIIGSAAYIFRYDGSDVNKAYMHCNYGNWRIDTEEHAEQIINEFREELMWYFTEFKDRMDGYL